MKRIIALCLSAVLSFCAFPLYATGIGPSMSAEGGVAIGDDTKAAGGISLCCSLKTDFFPIYWSINTGAFLIGDGIYSTDDAYFALTLTGDYWIVNPDIGKTWKWYLGCGGAVGCGIGSGGYAAAGPRVVLGVNTFTMDGFSEVFIQGALQAMATYDGNMSLRITFPIQAGMRLWY